MLKTCRFEKNWISEDWKNSFRSHVVGQENLLTLKAYMIFITYILNYTDSLIFHNSYILQITEWALLFTHNRIKCEKNDVIPLQEQRLEPSMV